MKEEYQTPVLEELESSLNCQFVAGEDSGLPGDPGIDSGDNND